MTKYCPLRKTMHLFEEDMNIMEMFCFNEFSEDVEFRKDPEWANASKGDILNDQDIIQLKYYITKTKDFEPSKQIIGDSCFLAARQHSYHPVKNYIESVQWDGVYRCDEWLINAAGCSDNEYVRMASSKFLIAAVARIYNPGCKFDHMLILEGSQGIGKSTLVENMAGSWFLDTNFDHRDKDLIDSMRGVMIVEISELGGMNKKDIDWLKSFLSKKVDRVRLPYAARSKDFKRKCVFVGTYNPSGNNMYLRDDTGNRRFWPVECIGEINIAYVRDNRAQLWAEALVRFRKSEDYYIQDNVALEILAGIHEERELEGPMYSTIKEWLKSQVNGEVEMNDIIQQGLKINMANRMPRDLLGVQTLIGITMKKLRWKKGTNQDRHKYFETEDSLTVKGEWDE